MESSITGSEIALRSFERNLRVLALYHDLARHASKTATQLANIENLHKEVPAEWKVRFSVHPRSSISKYQAELSGLQEIALEV